MLLLERQISDSYAYDGWSFDVVGVFSSFEIMTRVVSSKNSGEIVNHEPPRGYDNGTFEVKYFNGKSFSSFPTDHYTYREIELDKEI
jgi:hypothetical protein